jgi:hypothetical protein
MQTPKIKFVDNIKSDLGEWEWRGVGDWLIGLAQERDKWRFLVYAILNLRIPPNAIKFLSGCTTGGLSSSVQLHRASHIA